MGADVPLVGTFLRTSLGISGAGLSSLFPEHPIADAATMMATRRSNVPRHLFILVLAPGYSTRLASAALASFHPDKYMYVS